MFRFFSKVDLFSLSHIYVCLYVVIRSYIRFVRDYCSNWHCIFPLEPLHLLLKQAANRFYQARKPSSGMSSRCAIVYFQCIHVGWCLYCLQLWTVTNQAPSRGKLWTFSLNCSLCLSKTINVFAMLCDCILASRFSLLLDLTQLIYLYTPTLWRRIVSLHLGTPVVVALMFK